MKSYLEALQTILSEGELTPNRTGVAAITYPHLTIRHDMSKGFPLLTTKKMAWKTLKVELEFFIKGLTDKRWLQERGCHIWDEWCNPQRIKNDWTAEDIKNEPDLGPVYGYQWRQFSGEIDQFAGIVKSLKEKPTDRQLICSAWNPLDKHKQALPPCHVLWHVFTTNDKLHLSWFQRSCDFFLGVPFNLASYALLLHLLCKETGFKEGVVSGFFSNAHIYENHVDAVKEQLKREPFALPKVETKDFNSIFTWTYDQSVLVDYNFHPAIKAEIAV